LVEQRNALINSEGITPIDQASFAIRTAMKLKPDGKLENIANVAVPVLDKVLGHYQDLSNIIKAFDQLGTTDIAKAEPEKLNSLVQAGMKLFQHEDILTAATDKSVQNAYSANFGSDLEGLSITIADRLGSAPIILDTALGKEGFQAILPKILDLPNVRAISKLTDAQVESLKRATPAIADYMNKVAKAIVIGNPKLFKAVGKAAKEFREADSESRPAKLISLANAGMSLISEAVVSSAILNKESLTAIVSDFIPSANKKLGLAGIEIACDHKDYFLNAIRTVLKQPEAVKVAEILPKYLAATSAEEKSALLGELAVASAELAGNTQVSEAILDSEKLDSIIAQASKIPAMQELFSSFKEDLTPLREALQSATPSILNAAKQGIHKKEVQDLLIKGSALANSPLDTKKVIGLAKDAIKLYNNSPELHVTINENIAQKQKEIASIIDKSLSVVKKSSLSLRLLKPLGINGEFIVSMMQKINNSKGIEALEKCIDSPSISNIIGVLSSTQTRNFVLGHVTGSATKYALSGAKSISTNIGSMIGDNKSWVHRVTTNPTPIRNR